MRKITYLKTMLVAIVLIYGSARTSAQVLLTEDFDYSIGQVITPTTAADPMTGWLSHSGVGTGNIAVTNGLSFAGYAGSGVGGAAYLGNNGEDINKTFTAQTSGVFYISFLVKIDAVSNAGYFFNLGPNPMGSTYYSRVWVNATANGIGLGAGSTAPTSYISVTTGSTVLLVLKHDFTANTSSLFVLSSFSNLWIMVQAGFELIQPMFY